MKNDTYKNWFIFTLIYLIIDFGRPQDLLSIGFLKPGMIIILILSAYLVLKGPISAAYSKQTLMMGLFIALLAAYVPFARNNYYAYVATYDMLLFMPFILSTIICVNSIERLQKLVFVNVCLMIFISVYSILHVPIQYGNYFHDENDLSLYINMWIPFCFFLFFIEKNRFRKYFYLFGMSVGVLTIIASFSRGGFVGLLCVGFVCWLKSSRKIISLLIIGAVIIMVMFFASDQYWERIHTMTETGQGTAAVRIESWKAGWAMFLDNPLGVGGDNFMVRFPEYQSSFFKKGMWGRASHSLWFTLIPETGVIGIIIYLLLLKYNIKDIIFLNKITLHGSADMQYMRSLSAAFTGSLVGYFSSGTFLSVLYYPHYWYLTGFIVAAAKIARDLARQDNATIIEQPDSAI